MKNNRLLTTGQFAELLGVNKRTLMYYDDIGLFSPVEKGANGYRYYTLQQVSDLELLLALRELGMSIEEIRGYRMDPAPAALAELLSVRQRDIDEKIARLLEIRALLAEKTRLLEEAGAADEGIRLTERPTEYLALSAPISGLTERAEMEVVLDHARRFHTHRLFNHSFGTAISVEKLLRGAFDDYDRFFTRVPSPKRKRGLFPRPAGCYLETCCRGDWSLLPEKYRQILDYAKENRLTLSGYAYEEGLNDLAVRSMDEYWTKITIRCEREIREGRP